MAKFEVVTHSVFENVYYIEAETAAEAAQAFENDYDFFQKHLQEKVVLTSEINISAQEWQQGVRDNGFF